MRINVCTVYCTNMLYNVLKLAPIKFSCIAKTVAYLQGSKFINNANKFQIYHITKKLTC